MAICQVDASVRIPGVRVNELTAVSPLAKSASKRSNLGQGYKANSIEAAHPMVFAGAGFSTEAEAEVFSQQLVRAGCALSGNNEAAALKKLKSSPESVLQGFT